VDYELKSETLDDGTVRIELAGELDLLAAPAIREALGAIQANAVIVDLDAATFVDSTTLGALIGAQKRIRERGARLALVCANPSILTLFEITLLDRAFAICDSTATALESLAESA
jgi:anti-sigma B factor antagonist